MNNEELTQSTEISETTEVSEPVPVVVEVECIDYTEKLDTLIEIQAKSYELQQAQYVANLFTIGSLSAIIVIVVLYKAIKKLI